MAVLTALRPHSSRGAEGPAECEPSTFVHLSRPLGLRLSPSQPRLFSLAHRQGAGVIVAVQVVIMAVLEAKRIRGWKKTGMSGVLSSFPFDPMGMTSPEKKVKEVKNARLAMVAFVGMCSQAAVTGMGPIECLKAHIADPTHVNSACPKLFTVCVVIHAHAR